MTDSAKNRQVRNPGRARQGRHGPRLPRFRSGDFARGGDQGDFQGLGRRRRPETHHAALPARSAGGRPSRASAHRADLRLWRGRRGRLHRDGARQRQDAGAAPAAGDQLRNPRSRGNHPPVARRPRTRARGGRGSSRRQAVEHPDQQRRAHQDQRFRHRAHRVVAADAGRRRARHAALHGAGAVPGRGNRRAGGSVFGRRDRLRTAHRAQAVYRQLRRRHAAGAESGAGRSVDAESEVVAADRPRAAQGARQKTRRPVSKRARILRGVPGGHRRVVRAGRRAVTSERAAGRRRNPDERGAAAQRGTRCGRQCRRTAMSRRYWPATAPSASIPASRKRACWWSTTRSGY